MAKIPLFSAPLKSGNNFTNSFLRCVKIFEAGSSRACMPLNRTSVSNTMVLAKDVGA